MDEKMEENNNETEAKNDLKNTAEEKNIVKNSTIKNDANEAKNFFVNFFKTPFTQMQKVVNTPKSFFKIALIVFITWIVAEVIGSVITIVQGFSRSYYNDVFMYFRNSFKDFFRIFGAIVVPAIIIALIAVIIYLLMKDKKKSYFSILVASVIAYIPVASASIISLLGHINYNASKLTSAYSTFCSIITAILIFFEIKALHDENDDNKVAKTYLITMAIYYGISMILSLFGLYI